MAFKQLSKDEVSVRKALTGELRDKLKGWRKDRTGKDFKSMKMSDGGKVPDAMPASGGKLPAADRDAETGDNDERDNQEHNEEVEEDNAGDGQGTEEQSKDGLVGDDGDEAYGDEEEPKKDSGAVSFEKLIARLSSGK